MRLKFQKCVHRAANVGFGIQVLSHRNWEYWRPKSRREKILWEVSAILVGTATIVVFTVLCIAVLLSFVQLNIAIIFIWGECLREEVQERAAALGQECRDPQFLHGLWGLLAEIASDVSLAVLFDVLLAEVAKVLARCLVRLRNYQQLYEKRHAIVMLSVFIEALSKVGLFAIVGFVFLPQWPPTTSSNGQSQLSVEETCKGFLDFEICKALAGCSALSPTCCEGAMTCIAQRLTFPQRQRLFERAVKGPFCVAPFVRILATVIIPWVCGVLEKFVAHDARAATVARVRLHAQNGLEHPPGTTPSVRALAAWPRAGWTRRGVYGCVSFVFRILAIFLHLDSDAVGGFGYIWRGWPFGPIEVDAGDAGGNLEAVAMSAHDAVDQASRKVFEPLDELMELKMNFLLVVFMAPVMPVGLIPTLVARLLEVRFKATKLLFVRRRCWPGDVKLLHETQERFAQIAVHAAVVWHAGLVALAYNGHISEWGLWRVLAAWLGAVIALTFFLHVFIRFVRYLRVRRARRRGGFSRPHGRGHPRIP